jgi:hypothetical protein
MAGNVWEWVSDFYARLYYQYCVDNGIVNDPEWDVSSGWGIGRGGSFNNTWSMARVANRGNQLAADYGANCSLNPLISVGFRCARSGECIDNDHDGYGSPASTDCIYPELDCDDTDPNLNLSCP